MNLKTAVEPPIDADERRWISVFGAPIHSPGGWWVWSVAPHWCFGVHRRSSAA